MKNIFTFITAAFFLFYFNFAGLWKFACEPPFRRRLRFRGLAGYDSIYQFFA